MMQPIYINLYNTQHTSRQQGRVNYSMEKSRLKITWKLTLLAHRDIGAPKEIFPKKGMPKSHIPTDNCMETRHNSRYIPKLRSTMNLKT